MVLYQCCIKGCKAKDVISHRFPNIRLYPIRMREWMKIAGLEHQDSQIVYNKKRICGAHFTSDCLSPGTKRLKCNSYPTLHIPAAGDSSSSKESLHDNTENDFQEVNMPGTSSTNLDLSGSDVLDIPSLLPRDSSSKESLHDNTENYFQEVNMPGTSSTNLDLSGSDVLDIPSLLPRDSSSSKESLHDNTKNDFQELNLPGTSSTNLDLSGFDVLDTPSLLPHDDNGLLCNVTRISAQVKNRKIKKKDTGLLKQIGVTKCSHLTPKCKKLYTIANQLKKNCRRNGSRQKLFKSRLQAAETFSDKFLSKMTPAASMFTRLQVRETQKKNHGRRFTEDEKILSLSLFKRSPKCYRILSKLFTLPSKITLNLILSSVSVRPGISPLVMSVLKENVKKLKPIDRYCSILFDEISLSSGIQYTPATDVIDGFVDSGAYKNQSLADHALVFMVRGIRKKFKQPVIREVHKTGLIIVATISDQGRANEGAIKILNAETREYCIRQSKLYKDDFYEVEVDDTRLQIVHLFDVPHLIKCTRNNLLTKDLKFTIDGVQKTAKWEHIVQLYNADSAIPDSKMLPRLLDKHVIPEKISKMKVKCATQIFSHRVSAVMNFLATQNIIDSDAVDTATLLLFFDKLFDSMNGSFDKIVDGKIYRTAVKKNSVHHQLWEESLKILSSMKFVGKNMKTVSVPTLRNWMTTIRGFQYLSKVLDAKGLKSLLPRNLNQDPLENFFGAVRSLGCTNPTCASFIQSYKTLMLNNLVSPHSPGANCEEDLTEGTLTNYKNLFCSQQDIHYTQQNLTADLPRPSLPILSDNTEYLRQLSHTYISGFIIKKLNRDVLKDCKKCLKIMCTDQLSTEHQLISVREYRPTKLSLKYPSTSFRSLINNIITYINNVLPSICHHQQIKLTLVNNLSSNFDLSNLCCSDHTNIFKEKILNYIAKMFINHWCVEVNRILCGKRQIRVGEKDPIKILANVWYNSHSKKKKITGKYNQV